MTLDQILLAFRKRVLLALRGRYFVIEREGIKYLIDVMNLIDRHIEQYGVYEKPLLKQFLSEVRRLQPSLFLDIGANLGLYSLAVAHEFDSIEIMSFEPDSRNRSQLAANLFLNDLQDRIRVQDTALSDEDGQATFHRHEDENRGRSRIADDGAITVPKKRLDGMLQTRNARIAVKIDVEGHEIQVLKGMDGILSGNDCLIQIEAFETYPVVEQFLKDRGYELIFRYEDNFMFRRSDNHVAAQSGKA